MSGSLHSLSPAVLLIAASSGEGSDNFLVLPKGGLMVWTLIVFLATMYALKRLALPRIRDFLDERAEMISKQVDDAERTRREADELLAEYRERLTAAREQADDILARARKAADSVKTEATDEGREKREELVVAARKDIEMETRRSLERIRKEVADLTVMATEKVTRKSLDASDHQRLIEEALDEVDFSALTPQENGERGGGA